jgi:hypothetical protein
MAAYLLMQLLMAILQLIFLYIIFYIYYISLAGYLQNQILMGKLMINNNHVLLRCGLDLQKIFLMTFIL